MAKNKKTASRQRTRTASFDGVYLFKILLYLLLGSLWLKTGNHSGVTVSLPVGLAIGLVFASHEHFQIDRKIEYAVLVVATLFGLIAPYGLYIIF